VSNTDWKFIERILGDAHSRVIFLSGKPGTGKTFTAMRSGLGDRNVYSVTLTPETPGAELRGFWMPKGMEFVWQDGVFVKAMREGARVVINEIAHASHDVLALLYPVLESRETAALTLPSTETIVPAPGFQVICTDNVSIEYLPDALRDRFDCVLEINDIHPNAIARLDEKFRKPCLRAADLEGSRRVSIRGWNKVQEFEQSMGLEDAFSAVFGTDQGHHLYTATMLATEEDADTASGDET
jgi:MoxR-like ATPase